jgi:dTDP-4-amino-4,6-dideoxygalactose transaminase
VTSYRIPFNRPCVVGNEQAFIGQAIASRRLSGNGPFTHRCQAALESLTSATRVLLTGSCTHALDMASLLLDAEPGDEVIVPSFTFVSTANAFASRRLTPVFADCRPDTLNLDVRELPRLLTPRTRAIVAMHYGGVACEMEAITAFTREHRLTLIEDNAHGLFARYKGRPLGSFGQLATQSFHETKNVTCGEGGALLINDPALVDRAGIVLEKGTNRRRFLRGEVDKYTWVDVGSNFMPSELQAAYLCAQLEVWPAIQRRRHEIWSRYHEQLARWAAANGVRQPVVPEGCDHPAHVYFVLMPNEAARRGLIDHLKARGILAVFHYVPLHLSPMGLKFGGRPGACPVTECVSDQLLRLPFYADLGEMEQDEVIDAVQGFSV